MRRTAITATLAMVGLLALAACGGGGGGGDSDRPSATPTPPPPPPPPTPPRDTVDDARGGNARKILITTAEAAASGPQLGGLVQTSSENVANVSAVSASFDGAALDLSVSRADGSALNVNTDDDAYLGPFSLPSPIGGHTARDWGIAQVRDDGMTVARALVSWNTGDTADYLAGGYWMHFAGDADTLDFDGFEVGAFVDGPELSLTSPPNMPAAGTAYYSGPTVGIYAASHGTDTGVTPGSTEIGEFASTLWLNVDFAAQSIYGCVGCDDPLAISGVFVDAATGETEEFSDDDSGYELSLLLTTFDSNGTFSGQDLLLQHGDLEITRTEGAWGGQFSNVAGSGGAPRLVAGTYGADATTAGGSQGVFLGAFVGAN